jgi:site-specific DNA-methyltransferase (adenine-specific)
LAHARLIHGDCMDALQQGHIANGAIIISDPPYGMSWNTNTHRFSGGEQGVNRGKDWGKAIEGDDQPFDPAPWLEFDKVILWGSNHYAQRLPVGTTLVWVKRNDPAFGTFLSDAEIGWQKGGFGVYCHREAGGPSVRAAESGRSEVLHPTQKPLSLMGWCIERLNLPKHSMICDPFMGSGSTGVAALKLGFDFIGIEKDPDHYKTALERITREAGLFHTVSEQDLPA